jgi:MFS family permease
MNTPVSIFPSRALAFAAYFAALGFMVYQLTVQTMLVPLSDFVGADLGVSAMQMTVISAAFLATYACMQIPAGVLLDRFGATWLVPAACVCVGAGSIYFSHSHTFIGAVGARMLMGVAAAFAFPSIGMAARRGLPASMFPFMMGLADVGFGLGGVIGNIGASQLQPIIGWRGTMQAAALVALPLAAIAFVCLPRKWFGAAAAIKSATITHGGLRSVLKSREVRLAAVIYGGGCGTLFGFGSMWNQQLALAWDLLPNQASFISTAFFVGVGLGAPLTGWLGGKFGTERTLKWGLWLTLITLLVWMKPRILLGPDLPRIFDPPLWVSAINVGLIGLGVASSVLAFEIGCRALPTRLTATTVGVINLAGVGCGALLQVVPGFVPEIMHSKHYTEVQYANLFFVGALVAALVACRMVKRVGSSSQSSD